MPLHCDRTLVNVYRRKEPHVESLAKQNTPIKEPGKHVSVFLSILFQGGERWEWGFCTRKVERCSDIRTDVAALIHTDTQRSFSQLGNEPATSISTELTFRHRASCILGQAFHYSPENAFYIFNQQIYFII